MCLSRVCIYLGGRARRTNGATVWAMRLSFADARWLNAVLDQTDSAGNGNEMLLELMANYLNFHSLYWMRGAQMRGLAPGEEPR